MKNQIKEKQFVHNLYINNNFSEDELLDAKSILIDNQTTFYRQDYIGYKLRENAINIWKKELISNGKRSKSELNDEIGNIIIADLENNIDIKNAIIMNVEDSNKEYILSLKNKE